MIAPRHQLRAGRLPPFGVIFCPAGPAHSFRWRTGSRTPAGGTLPRHLERRVARGERSGVNIGGVNHKTVETAVRQLEREGFLVKPGPWRPRLIQRPASPATRSSLSGWTCRALRSSSGTPSPMRGWWGRPHAGCWRGLSANRCRPSPSIVSCAEFQSRGPRRPKGGH